MAWLRTLVKKLGWCVAWRKSLEPQGWRIPGWSLSCLFSPVSGRADEAEGLPSAAHQLHTQNYENHQVPWLGASLPRETPSYPGPGARRSEDLHPPLLCVSHVLPSVYISGDVILASLLRGGWERACLGWTGCARSIAAWTHRPQRHPSGLCLPLRTADSVSPMCFNRWRWLCLLSTPWWQRTTPWMQRRLL